MRGVALAHALVLAAVTSAGPLYAQTRARPSPPRAGAASPSDAVAPPSDPIPAARAGKLREDGNAAMLSMRYADALEAYKGALALTPDDVGLQYSLARAYQFLGDYPNALAALDAFDKQATPEAKSKVGKLDELFADLRPRVATLDLTCSVPGARVLVRDTIVGTTPLPTTRLPAGASTIAIELDGFFPEKRDVVLPGGGTLELDVSLQPKSTSGLLGVTSDPLGALITVDGRPLGTTSPRLEVALGAGPHEMRATHDGYDDAKVSFVLAPGATRDVSIPLDKSRSIATRWWFWTAVGVAVAGGVVLTYALTTEKSAGHGTLTPGQVGGP